MARVSFEVSLNLVFSLSISFQVGPEESDPISSGNPEALGAQFLHRSVQAQQIGEPFFGFEGMYDHGTVEIDDVKRSQRVLPRLHEEILEVEIGMVDSHFVHFPHQPPRLAYELPFFTEPLLIPRLTPSGEVLNEIDGVANFPGNKIPLVKGPKDRPLNRDENLHRWQSGLPCHFGDDEFPKWTETREEEVDLLALLQG